MCAALLGALTTTGVAFGHVDTWAGAIFVPYFAWVAYASTTPHAELLAVPYLSCSACSPVLTHYCAAALNYTLMEKNPKVTPCSATACLHVCLSACLLSS